VEFEPTNVDGCFVASLTKRGDERGFFARAWCADAMLEVGAPGHVSQINMSGCEEAGLIRGLHWQAAPHEEAKFMRTIAGATYNVCADVRPNSLTFGQWFGVELSAENRLALVVPEGCANGYQALEVGSEVLYLTSAGYSPDAERGIRHDDPFFEIDWPITEGIQVSDKDASWVDFQAG
jgi:dTDP-4-dehydrorhamnose 3,5-epimerase